MRKHRSGMQAWIAGAIAATALLARPASAVVKAGEQQASVTAGAAIPLMQFDFSAVGGTSEKTGGSGVGFGGQYLYHLTPALGLGGEFNYASFGDQTHNVTKAVVTSSYKTWSMEAVARYVLMPEAKVNPYLIAGLGVGATSAKATTKPAPGFVWANTGTTESRTNFDGSATGAAFSIGAGADADITDSLFAGLELRWRYAGASKTYVDGVDSSLRDSVPAGTGLGIAGRIGWKFGR